MLKDKYLAEENKAVGTVNTIEKKLFQNSVK